MSTFKHISVDDAKSMIEAGDVSVVDIRDGHAFEISHLPSAKSLNDTNIDIFLAEADKERPLICYCYHGISSQNAAAFFVSKGFKDVYSMDGGYEGWRVKYA